MKVDSSPVSKERQTKNLPNPLANCFFHSVGEYANNPLLQSLEVLSTPVNLNPVSAEVELLYKNPIRREDYPLFLKLLVRRTRTVLEDHQRIFSKKKVRIEIQQREHIGQKTRRPEVQAKSKKHQSQNRLLTRGEYKNLTFKLRSELEKQGFHKPLLSLCSARIDDCAHNLALVQVDHDSYDYARLRVVRNIIKAWLAGEKKTPRVDILFARKVRIIDKRHHTEGDFQSTPSGFNIRSKALFARYQTERALTQHPCSLEDWRARSFTGIDAVGVKKPEDIHFAEYLDSGRMRLCTAFPAEISENRHFQTGLDCVALGIEREIAQDGSILSVNARLVAIKQNYWVSCSRANDFLDVLRAERGKINAGEREALHNISRLHQASQLTAGNSMVHGVVLQDIFEASEAEQGVSSGRPRYEFNADGINNHLMISAQQDLAQFMARQRIPQIVRRLHTDFDSLRPEFQRVFGRFSGPLIAVCSLSEKSRDQVIRHLEQKGEYALIAQMSKIMIRSQIENRFTWALVCGPEDLQFMDRTPFKPKHGSPAAFVNQIQLAAHCMNAGDILIGAGQMRKILFKIMTADPSLQTFKERGKIADIRDKLRHALYSRPAELKSA